MWQKNCYMWCWNCTMWRWNRQMWKEKKKVKESPNVRKKTIICDVGIAQCEDETVKCEKKVREPPNVRKELFHQMWEKNCHMWC